MKYVPGEKSPDGHNHFLLSTGRKLTAQRLCIDDCDGEMYVTEVAFEGDYSESPRELTDAERAEIADYAMDLWRQWRHQRTPAPSDLHPLIDRVYTLTSGKIVRVDFYDDDGGIRFQCSPWKDLTDSERKEISSNIRKELEESFLSAAQGEHQ